MNKKYVLLLILFGLHVGAMDIVQQPTKEVNKKEKIGKYESLVEDISHKIILKTKSVDGVVSDKHILFDKNILSSVESLQMLWERRQDKNEYAIFVADEFELDTYGFVLDIVDLFMSRKSDKIIKINQKLDGLRGLNELVEVINCAYFLQVNDKVLKFFATKIIDWIKKSDFLNDYEKLLLLNSYFAETYVLPQIMVYVIGYLKVMIVKRNGFTKLLSKSIYPADSILKVDFFNSNKDDSGSHIMWTLGSSGQIVDVVSKMTKNIEVTAEIYGHAVFKEKYVALGLAQHPANLVIYDFPSYCSLNEGSDCLNCMAFSPSGRYLLSTGWSVENGCKVILWKTDSIDVNKNNTKECQCDRFAVENNLDDIIGVDFASDSHFFILGYEKEKLKLIRVDIVDKHGEDLLFEKQEIVSVDMRSFRKYYVDPYEYYFDKLENFAFSFDHKKAVVLIYGKEEDTYKMIFMDMVSGDMIIKDFSIKKDGFIRSIAFESSNSWVACVKKGTISLYDVSNGEHFTDIEGLYYGNNIIRFSADGKKIMLVGKDSIGAGFLQEKLLVFATQDLSVGAILTDQQAIDLNTLKEQMSFYEAILMYRLCQVSSNNNFILSEDDDLFKKLTDENKNLLKNIGLTEQTPKKTWRQWFAQRSWKEIFGRSGSSGWDNRLWCV